MNYKIFIMPIMAMISSCSNDSSILKYKIAVSVNTPDGVRTGSTVRQVGVVGGSWNDSFSKKSIGEAVIVELPGDKKLFVLLMSEDGDVDNWKRMPRIAFPEYWHGKSKDDAGAFRNLKKDRPESEIWPLKNNKWSGSRLPMMVTFRDLDDPKSIKIINPDDMKDIFGDGYSLNGIKVSITSDKIESKIFTVLKWLNNQKGMLVPSVRWKDIPIEHRTNQGSFYKDTAK